MKLNTPINKPPLGVIPCQIYYEKRIEDLKRCIREYINSNLPVNENWIIEYNTIINMFKEMGIDKDFY